MRRTLFALALPAFALLAVTSGCACNDSLGGFVFNADVERDAQAFARHLGKQRATVRY